MNETRHRRGEQKTMNIPTNQTTNVGNEHFQRIRWRSTIRTNSVPREGKNCQTEVVLGIRNEIPPREQNDGDDAADVLEAAHRIADLSTAAEEENSSRRKSAGWSPPPRWRIVVRPGLLLNGVRDSGLLELLRYLNLAACSMISGSSGSLRPGPRKQTANRSSRFAIPVIVSFQTRSARWRRPESRRAPSTA